MDSRGRSTPPGSAGSWDRSREVRLVRNREPIGSDATARRSRRRPQPDLDERPAVGRADQFERSAPAFGELASDREPEARASGRSRAAPRESLGDGLTLVGGDARAVIAHGEHRALRARRHRDLDRHRVRRPWRCPAGCRRSGRGPSGSRARAPDRPCRW